MTESEIREEALRRYPVKINFQDEGDHYDQNEDFREFWIEGGKFVLDALKEEIEELKAGYKNEIEELKYQISGMNDER